MEYLSFFHKKGNPPTCDNMNELGGHYTQWAHHTEKDKYCVVSFLYRIFLKRFERIERIEWMATINSMEILFVMEGNSIAFEYRLGPGHYALYLPLNLILMKTYGDKYICAWFRREKDEVGHFGYLDQDPTTGKLSTWDLSSGQVWLQNLWVFS